MVALLMLALLWSYTRYGGSAENIRHLSLLALLWSCTRWWGFCWEYKTSVAGVVYSLICRIGDSGGYRNRVRSTTKFSGVLASNRLEMLVFRTEWLLTFAPVRLRPALSAALLRNFPISFLSAKRRLHVPYIFTSGVVTKHTGMRKVTGGNLQYYVTELRVK